MCTKAQLEKVAGQNDQTIYFNYFLDNFHDTLFLTQLSLFIFLLLSLTTSVKGDYDLL